MDTVATKTLASWLHDFAHALQIVGSFPQPTDYEGLQSKELCNKTPGLPSLASLLPFRKTIPPPEVDGEQMLECVVWEHPHPQYIHEMQKRCQTRERCSNSNAVKEDMSYDLEVQMNGDWLIFNKAATKGRGRWS